MRRVRRISDNAETTVRERGVTTLFLTFGALRWRDDQFGDSVSPLWMVPCEIVRKGPDAPLHVRLADEEVQVNPALEYYLREKHRLQLPDIPDEPDAAAMRKYGRDVANLVRTLKWTTENETWLSTFSFESLVIYQDLKALATPAMSNRIVASLARATATTARSESLPNDLDTLPSPNAVPIPVLPADSSQLEGLAHAGAGRHVVMHGPPGTGKSQTIANLISDALGRKQKVLFVSAKMAALNVVHDRLKDLGLDLFCLEAHSTKAGKAKIIDELRRTIESEIGSDGSQLEEELTRLLHVRDSLNCYIRAVHRRVEPFGITAYQAIGRLEKLLAAPVIRAPIPWPDPLQTTRRNFDECCDLLEGIAAMADVFDRRDLSPWRGFSPPALGVQEQEQTEDALAVLRKSAMAMGEVVCALSGVLGASPEITFEQFDVLTEGVTAIAEAESLPALWWREQANQLDHRTNVIRQAAANREEADALRIEMKSTVIVEAEAAVTLFGPIETIYAGWHCILRPSYWRWRVEARRSLAPGSAFGRGLVVSTLRRAQRIRQLDDWFAANSDVLGELTSATAPALLSAALSYRCAAIIRRSCDRAGLSPQDSCDCITPQVKQVAKRFLELSPSANSTLGAALSLIEQLWPRGLVDGGPIRQTRLTTIIEKIDLLLGDLRGMAEWARLSRLLVKCNHAGLDKFLSALNSISAKDLRHAFERRFFSLWISALAQRHPEIAEFNVSRHEELIDRFRNFDESVRRLATGRARTVASLDSQRIRSANDQPGIAGQVGILRYELQKKKRIKPLRRLFAEIPQVLQALKPCMLMSPISVSTYLKPDSFHFDLVVFDEASQLPTAEAVPSILRGAQVVVAGDSMQSPPTSFFESSLVCEDDDEEDEPGEGQVPLESLLDDCVAIVPVFQESHLHWHYRSRDERLIRFSNHFFYDNHLLTFPAPEAGTDDRGVRLVYVQGGVWDRGRSKTNRVEARVVARLALEHFEQHPDRSLGVVALNSSQKEAIEEALEEELASRPDLAPMLDCSNTESMFVKSLENVQGDERDTMIISVGYGRDADGGLSMNFGPINRDGGWRRLNVLVTRAKWQCILVTSLRSRELSGINPNNRGAVSLRNYLEYAEQGGRAAHRSSDEHSRGNERFRGRCANGAARPRILRRCTGRSQQVPHRSCNT